MVGEAVKVTDVPGQMVVEDAEMLTEAATLGVTVMVFALEVAGEPLTQVRLDVIMQVITSVLTSALLL